MKHLFQLQLQGILGNWRRYDKFWKDTWYPLSTVFSWGKSLDLEVLIFVPNQERNAICPVSDYQQFGIKCISRQNLQVQLIINQRLLHTTGSERTTAHQQIFLMQYISFPGQPNSKPRNWKAEDHAIYCGGRSLWLKLLNMP